MSEADEVIMLSQTAKFRVSFLEKRRKRLAFWLSTVLLHSILGGSQQVKAWILE